MTEETIVTEEDEIIMLDSLYTYSFNQIDNRKNVKRHTETKSLYLLQATAVLLTLFSLIDLDATGTVFSPRAIEVFSGIFYFLIAYTVFILLISLNDSLFNSNKNIERLSEVQNPLDLYNLIRSNSLNSINFKLTLIASCDDCIKALDLVIERKNSLFNKALIGFSLSMATILLMLFGMVL